METLLFKGFVLGFIFSVIMVPGAFWCVQVTRQHGLRSGLAVVWGITLGQAVWIAVAIALMGVLSLLPLRMQLDWVFRTAAAALMLYMSLMLLRARKAESLACPSLPGGRRRIFRGTLAVSLGMPMRFFGYMAFCVAANLGVHPGGVTGSVFVVVGAIIGTLLWWLYLVGLAVLFGKRVPERITLRSLNKLSRLGSIVLILVCVLTVLPLLARGG
ncbi:LysE family transporter [Ruficoccus sp. ZRK36]|uniref:LysE family transporter n=1 Tax=Ruficoccus sp. ZRK36 TaxID=2866311 RepID=UPI001C7378C2|nr:LysE family transporter [Ruficoccus sp. ZRK36]QYY36992.1 LysE family transporter [Ruficoccus sp. ZRK36]